MPKKRNSGYRSGNLDPGLSGHLFDESCIVLWSSELAMHPIATSSFTFLTLLKELTSVLQLVNLRIVMVDIHVLMELGLA